ncbi:hypothetical protein TNCV_2470281 [Trichonephila clavipes]|nr:hypothetical protein TNCV_2470281 [Trichonephila clavipes]
MNQTYSIGFRRARTKGRAANVRSPHFFIIDHTIENSPFRDDVTRIAADIVSELRVYTAANVVELFVQYLLSCRRPQFSRRDCTIHLDYEGNMTVF